MALKVKQYGVYTTVPKHKGTENFKIKVLGKKMNHTNTSYKVAGVAMLLSIKVGFKAKSIAKENEKQ